MVWKQFSQFFQVSALALLVSGMRPAVAREEVPWAPDLETARHVARQMNQMVLLHFWSPDCVPCRRLEATVFADRGFANRVATHYVPVKVNVTTDPSLAYQYGVRQWPTDVITTPDGRLVHKMVSPQDPAEYVDILDRVARSKSPDSPVDPQRDEPPRNNAGLASYSDEVAKQAPPRYETPGTSRYSSAGSNSEPTQPYTSRQTGLPARGSRTPYDDVYDRYARDYTQEQQTPPSTQGPVPRDYAGSAAEQPWQGPTEIRNQYVQDRGSNDYVNRDLDDAWNEHRRGEPVVDTSSTIDNRYVTPRSRSDVNRERDDHLAQASRSAAVEPTVSRNSAEAEASPYGRGTMDQGQPHTPTAAAMHRGQPQPTKLPAMDGYCPVTLIDGAKWAKGDSRFGLEHRGRTYLFSSEEARRTFWANPDRFSPALSGADPVALFDHGRHVDGKRQHGLVYKDHVYLFGSEETLREFYKTPDRYAEQVRVATRAATVSETTRR